MNDRSFSILKATVKEFVDTGEPVSSGWLYDNYEFGIRPAMIRLEMRDLEEQGLLSQPSHSAGRIPTDRGLRFFAENILSQEFLPQDDLLRALDKGGIPSLLGRMSEMLGLLGVAAEMSSGEIFKQGLNELINRLDWTSPKEVRSVVNDFEKIEEKVPDSEFLSESDFLKVFIGRSPITKSECLTVFAGDYDLKGEHIFLFGIGPKRMNYEKTAKVFKGLKKNK